MAGNDRLAIINTDGSFANSAVNSYIAAVAQAAVLAGGGGGGGAPLTSYLTQVAALSDYPTTFTPATHTHVIDNISDAGVTGKLALAAASAAGLRTVAGLGSVDNTADTAKPVSTAQQTALDAKRNLSQRHTIPIFYVSGAWEHTSLASAQAAGFQTTDQAIFTGNPGGTPPSWMRDNDLWTMG